MAIALVGSAALADSPQQAVAGVGAAPRIATIIAPTRGRPVFVPPGGSFVVAARLPEGAQQAGFALRSAPNIGLRFVLELDANAWVALSAGQPVELTIPPSVPHLTYDLEFVAGETRVTARRCVRVGSLDGPIRLVHLSNLNVGDFGAPTFDERLVDEINLLAPTAIVMTGDLLDATHPRPSRGWQDLIEWLDRFDAPVIAACGDHDDIGRYSKHLAPSPIGTVQLGPHRFHVLYDLPLTPIYDDAGQLQWLGRELAATPMNGLNIIVTHDDAPHLLMLWQQQGVLSRMIRNARIGLWFCGGATDWDGRVNRDLVEAARPMLYLRTHRASTTTSGGALGVSHYRVVDLTGDRAILVEAPDASETAPPSIAAGRLSAVWDGSNDGSRARLSFRIVNNHASSLPRLSVWPRVRKTGETIPWCIGGKLVQAIDQGSHWLCQVLCDVPDKGTVAPLIGTEAIPVTPDCRVNFDVPTPLRFKAYLTRDGLAFQSLINAAPLVRISNAGQDPFVTVPLIRLDGDPIAYRRVESQSEFVTATALRIEPGEVVGLQLDMSAVRVSPGRRVLQVYPQGGPATVPFGHAVQVVIDR